MRRVVPIVASKGKLSAENDDDDKSDVSSSLDSGKHDFTFAESTSEKKNTPLNNADLKSKILKDVLSNVLPDDGEYDIDGMMAGKAKTSNSFIVRIGKFLGFLDLEIHEAVATGSFYHVQRAVRKILSGKESYPYLINQFDEKGRTPLSIATKIKSTQIVAFLLTNNALPDIPDESTGRTPLMFSVLNRTTEISQYLVNAGASVNFADYQSVTPLMLAASIDSISQCKILCSKRIRVDAQDFNGWTALHYCACFNSREVMQYLIVEEGANRIIKDNNKRKPVDIAKFKNHGECIAILSDRSTKCISIN